MGASVFGGSFMWWYAPSFRDDTDRSMIFKTYFVVSLEMGWLKDLIKKQAVFASISMLQIWETQNSNFKTSAQKLPVERQFYSPES